MQIEKDPMDDLLVEKKIEQDQQLKEAHAHATALLEDLSETQMRFIAAANTAVDSFDNRTIIYAQFTDYQRIITRFKWYKLQCS